MKSLAAPKPLTTPSEQLCGVKSLEEGGRVGLALALISEDPRLIPVSTMAGRGN